MEILIAILAIMYIIGGVLAYGMSMAEWFEFHEERGRKENDDIVRITSDVWGVALLPLGFAIGIWDYIAGKRKYFIKWSFKGMNA